MSTHERPGEPGDDERSASTVDGEAVPGSPTSPPRLAFGPELDDSDPRPVAYTVRTADEIQHRLRVSGDIFGWEQDTLARYLTFDESRGFSSDTADEWATYERPRTAKAIRIDALAYLDYAWLRPLRHRNIESQRAMLKLDRWCWLLGSNLARFEPDDIEPRGTYCVRAIAGAAAFLGVAFPPTHARETVESPRVALTPDQRSKLSIMYGGRPCTKGCPQCLDTPTESVAWPTT